MLVFVATTIIVLIWCLLLHYQMHFIFQCCRKRATFRARASSGIPASSSPNARTRSTSAILQSHQSKYRCMFTSADSEDFDFFPVAFFFYLLFLIFICTMVILKCFIFDAYDDTEFGSYFINSFHEHFLSLTSQNNHSSVFGTHGIHSIDILDFILVYSIMIMAIFESLFSFYRYYTTLYGITQCRRPSPKSVMKKFFCYALTFAIAFIAEIHLTYWMFPIVVLLHFTFNVYCTLKFASLLIQKYQIFITLGGSSLNKNSDEHILKSVYFMRKTSLLCTLSQSFCLSLFVISYNIDIIYYLPILWGISCIIFTMNFVRNRQCVTNFVFAIFWKCRYSKCSISIENYIQHRRAQHRTNSLAKMESINVDLTAIAKHPSPQNNMSVEDLRIKIHKKHKSPTHNKVDSESTVSPPTPVNHHKKLDLRSPSVPVFLERERPIPMPPKNPNMSGSFSTIVLKKQRYSPKKKNFKAKKTKKAFEILGLKEDDSIINPSPIVGAHKRSQTSVVFGGNNKDLMQFTPSFTGLTPNDTTHQTLDLNSSSVPLPSESEAKNIKNRKFKSKPGPMTGIEECEEKDESMNGITGDAIVGNHILKKKHSTPKTPLIMDDHSMPTPLIGIGDGGAIAEINAMNEVIFEEDEMGDDFVYMDEDMNIEDTPMEEKGNTNFNIPKITITPANSVLGAQSAPMDLTNNDSKYGKHSKGGTLSKILKLGKLTPRRTPKVRMTPSIDRRSIDLDNVVKSLEILVDYGFCSRVSMNNIKQIRLYREQYLLDGVPETTVVHDQM